MTVSLPLGGLCLEALWVPLWWRIGPTDPKTHVCAILLGSG
jgi:hypothetical protein